MAGREASDCCTGQDAVPKSARQRCCRSGAAQALHHDRPPLQVTKLDNDGASARPGGAAPAKLAAFLQLGQQQAAERQEEQQAEARQQQQHEQEQQPAAAEALPHWVEPGLADASTTQQGAAPPRAMPASQRPERQQEQPQPEQRNEQASSQVLAQGEPGMQDRSVAGGPSPAKQESLERCLARAAAQSQGAEELVAEQRQRLLRQWQGVSLSQVGRPQGMRR